MILKGLLLGLLLLFNGIADGVHGMLDESFSTKVGETVIFTCPVDIDACGDLHSLNWFKGDKRIAVFLADGNSTNVVPEYKSRVTIEQSPYRLIIKDLQISDEELYICDTTYFIPQDTCEITRGYRMDLKVLVPPSEIVILDEKGDRIENGTILGPLQEGHVLRSTCVVKNTRPQPAVGWFRGTKRLTTHSPTYDETDGLYTASLELSLVLSRLDLANTIECRVESAALDRIITSHMEVDLQVRPTQINLSGVEHHTVQGSKVVLTCTVVGARPAANVSWTNSSVIIGTDDNMLTEIRTQATEQNDGTYETKSDLIFVATRFENDMQFRCDADNVVLRANREKPVYSFVTLEVMYPPVIRVSPDAVTVNTTDAVLLNCQYVANPASLTSVKWYKSGELVLVNSSSRYEGGNSENVALAIKETENNDSGNYTCELSNTIGKAVSETQIELDVQYVPTVEVLMVPEGPVRENDETNVTLYCNVLDANPATLLRVRWYANSTLLKELPDCTETNEDLCHIDPSKLLLESIGRGFFYNYSCEGFNQAGWGPRSEDKELVVLYEPGPSVLTHYPLIAVKKKSVTFSCSVDDPGNPESNRFRWFRGGRGPLQDIVTKDWTMEPVGLDSRTNYSCHAYNEGGTGQAATVYLEVHAPPFFIKNLFPYTGVLYSSKNASLTCRIECVPRCAITWYKDGAEIDLKSSSRYFVKEEYMGASPATGDFESVMSVLHFNMSAWPNKKFDVYADNANYTCMSSANTVGAGVKSATYFSIEYSPENTTVSHDIVHVVEDTIPGRVLCTSKANPEPSYEWRYNNKTITRGNALIINSPMARNETGRYTCVAFNKHGTTTSETLIDVQYKPRCEIERKEIDDEDTLICTSFGNPDESDFTWSIKTENDSSDLGGGNVIKDRSLYVLDDDYDITRTYRCVANNTVGFGTFCEIEVAGQLAWWQRWDRTTLIILVASILAVLLAVIIICCIIICICRRRRRQDKYHTDVSISATQSVLSYQPAKTLPPPALQTLPEVPKSPPRWPLRPGVMVHVKNDTKQTLCANRMGGVATMPRTATTSTLTNTSASSPTNTTTQVTIETQPSTSLGDDDAAKQSAHNSQPGGGSSSRSQTMPRLPPKTNTVRVNPNNTIATDVGIGAEGQEEGQQPTPPPPLPRRNPPRRTRSTKSVDMSTGISVLPQSLKMAANSPSDNDDDDVAEEEDNDTLDGGAATGRGGLFEKIFGEIFSRKGEEIDTCRDSQRSHTRLLNMFRVSQKKRQASSPFAVKHRLKGIRSSGSVTYKKSQTPAERPAALVDRNCNAITPPSKGAVTTSTISSATKMIHGKSSTLGDPLTEPGEYENLPFHGLQTAPNKFTTTPINFNNANVVRVAPRPKAPQPHPQQQQQQSYNTIQISSTNTNTINSRSPQPNPPGNGIQYNLNSCFPKSYTEYYHHQQHHQQQQKFSTSNSQLLNSIETDYPYTVERAPSGAANNPFLAQNFKKFDTASANGTAHRKSAAASAKPSAASADKKFYSLKFSGNRKGLHLSSIKPRAILTTGKCKRHHSFAGDSAGDGGGVDSLAAQPAHMRFYEPPVYENLTDSIQILECNVESHHMPAAATAASSKRKPHRQHQRHKMDDFQRHMEPERLSIYRSDSGISNSSYECVTPVPAPRQAVDVSSSSRAAAAIYAQHGKMAAHTTNPVYMNVGAAATPGGSTSSTSSPSTLVHTFVDSPNEPSSASTASTTAAGLTSSDPADPTSLSSSCNSSNRCTKHSNQSQSLTNKEMRSSATANRKCKRRTQSSCSSLMSLERAPNTNPFLATNPGQNGDPNQTATTTTASSSRQPKQQQQLLVPKELFPPKKKRANNGGAGGGGYSTRPIKLPLRKHHSFHFQPSQTVAGIKSKQKQQTLGATVATTNGNGTLGAINSSYKLNGGPLVFKPFLNESSAFKPISPVAMAADNIPRICGTSLKRHMSNVETYDSSRYGSNPRLAAAAAAAALNGYDEDETDPELNEIAAQSSSHADDDEVDMASISSSSTIVGQRLIYADLAQLSYANPVQRISDRILTPLAVGADDDLIVASSDSEQYRQRGNRRQNEAYREAYEEDDVGVMATPTRQATRYATLKYNEVKI